MRFLAKSHGIRIQIGLALFLAQCLGCTTDQNHLVLTEKSAGPFMVGQPHQAVLNYGKRFKLRQIDGLAEGEPSTPRVEVYKNEKLLVVIELFKNSVDRIRVISDEIRTSDGIGVGSALRDLKKHFRTSPELVYGEDGLFAVFKSKDGTLSFALDIAPERNTEAVSDQTRATFILITQGQEPNGSG